MNDDASLAIARFRAAQDRRADDRELRRERLKRAETLSELIDLQRDSGRTQQASANVGFPHLKRRPS